MKRTWTIIGVRDVARAFEWYQSRKTTVQAILQDLNDIKSVVEQESHHHRASEVT